MSCALGWRRVRQSRSYSFSLTAGSRTFRDSSGSAAEVITSGQCNGKYGLMSYMYVQLILISREKGLTFMSSRRATPFCY